MQAIGLQFALVFLFATVTFVQAADRGRIKVEPAAFDRENVVISFAGADLAATHARSADGKLLPIQREEGGQVSFMVPSLPKGTSANYELVSGGGSDSGSSVKAVRADKKLKVSLGDRPLLEFQAEPGAFPRDDIKELFRRGGYIHPVLSPSGKMITDDFPPNHIHHHGIWWSWTKTEFDGRHPDFWNMGDGKGKVDFVAMDKSWSGPVHAGWTARFQYVDLTATQPTVAVRELWEVKVYNTARPEQGWIFDLVSTHECASDKPLKLPEYRYGGLGLRGNRAWNGKENTHFLTSEGITDREKGHATRARWCDMSGSIDGSQAGITIFCHPENFRAPQPMRIHPDEPFFNYAPMQAGDMVIEPGKKYVSRYRFFVHDGPPDKAAIEAIWNDYAHPARVSVASGQ